MTKKKKSTKREVIEWVVIIAVVGTIWLTGWHTEVIGQIQRAMLATGILKPSLEEGTELASYNFAMKTLDGESVSFEEFRGKTVFLNFWATWCPPCVAEMPDIHSLYEEMNGEVAFVMISMDEDQQKARNYIARKGYTFPVYFLDSGLPKVYNPRSIPTTYVVSPDGAIVMTRHGMAKYHTDSFEDFLRSL